MAKRARCLLPERLEQFLRAGPRTDRERQQVIAEVLARVACEARLVSVGIEALDCDGICVRDEREDVVVRRGEDDVAIPGRCELGLLACGGGEDACGQSTRPSCCRCARTARTTGRRRSGSQGRCRRRDRGGARTGPAPPERLHPGEVVSVVRSTQSTYRAAACIASPRTELIERVAGSKLASASVSAPPRGSGSGSSASSAMRSQAPARCAGGRAAAESAKPAVRSEITWRRVHVQSGSRSHVSPAGAPASRGWATAHAQSARAGSQAMLVPALTASVKAPISARTYVGSRPSNSRACVENAPGSAAAALASCRGEASGDSPSSSDCERSRIARAASRGPSVVSSSAVSGVEPAPHVARETCIGGSSGGGGPSSFRRRSYVARAAPSRCSAISW